MTATERLRGMLLGPDGIRAGWRFLAFAGLWYWLVDTPYGVFALVVKIYRFSDTGFTPTDLMVGELVSAVTLLAISALLVRLEKHRWTWFGLPFEPGGLKLFGWGCVWGWGIITVLLLASWSGGYVSFQGWAEHGTDLWRYLVIWLLAMLGVGLTEEMQFRGYAQSALTRGLGFWPAALLLSLLFGAEHLQKPMETPIDIGNIVLLGLFMAYSVRQTGSIWFAIGFHAAFDFFALSFYGSPNTGNNGLPLEHHLLDTHIAGPAWLTGGPQGLEASWLVPPLTLAMFLLLCKFYPETRYPRD